MTRSLKYINPTWISSAAELKAHKLFLATAQIHIQAHYCCLFPSQQKCKYAQKTKQKTKHLETEAYRQCSHSSKIYVCIFCAYADNTHVLQGINIQGVPTKPEVRKTFNFWQFFPLCHTHLHEWQSRVVSPPRTYPALFPSDCSEPPAQGWSGRAWSGEGGFGGSRWGGHGPTGPFPFPFQK